MVYTTIPENIEQVDAVLSEDGRSVMFYLYRGADDCEIRVINLNRPIAENTFCHHRWRTWYNTDKTGHAIH